MFRSGKAEVKLGSSLRLSVLKKNHPRAEETVGDWLVRPSAFR